MFSIIYNPFLPLAFGPAGLYPGATSAAGCSKIW